MRVFGMWRFVNMSRLHLRVNSICRQPMKWWHPDCSQRAIRSSREFHSHVLLFEVQRAVQMGKTKTNKSESPILALYSRLPRECYSRNAWTAQATSAKLVAPETKWREIWLKVTLHVFCTFNRLFVGLGFRLIRASLAVRDFAVSSFTF